MDIYKAQVPRPRYTLPSSLRLHISTILNQQPIVNMSGTLVAQLLNSTISTYRGSGPITLLITFDSRKLSGWLPDRFLILHEFVNYAGAQYCVWDWGLTHHVVISMFGQLVIKSFKSF